MKNSTVQRVLQRTAYAALFGFAAASPMTASAAVGDPLGPSVRVPTDPVFEQGSAQIARAANGAYAVVWSQPSDNPDGSRSTNIFARAFAADGTPQSDAFEVNQSYVGSLLSPRIAMDAAGDFIVVWSDLDPSSSKMQLFGRRFDAGGAPLGDEFAVTSSESRIGSYAVAMAPDGRFVVLIERLSQLSASLGVVALGSSTFTVQRYDADGSRHGLPILAGGRPALEISVPLGVPSSLPPFLILGTNAGAPAVAMDTAGDFVIVWAATSALGVVHGGGFVATSETDAVSTYLPATHTVYARHYSAAGVPTTLLPMVVDSVYTTNGAYDAAYVFAPRVAMESDGDFVVVWQRAHTTWQIMLRRYVDDAPQSPIEVSGGIDSATVAVSDNGQSVVVWRQGVPDSDGSYVSRAMARVFDENSTPLTGPLVVDATQSGAQTLPGVGADALGNFVVDWDNTTPTGEPGTYQTTVYARRFSGS